MVEGGGREGRIRCWLDLRRKPFQYSPTAGSELFLLYCALTLSTTTTNRRKKRRRRGGMFAATYGLAATLLFNHPIHYLNHGLVGLRHREASGIYRKKKEGEGPNTCRSHCVRRFPHFLRTNLFRSFVLEIRNSEEGGEGEGALCFLQQKSPLQSPLFALYLK